MVFTLSVLLFLINLISQYLAIENFTRQFRKFKYLLSLALRNQLAAVSNLPHSYKQCEVITGSTKTMSAHKPDSKKIMLD